MESGGGLGEYFTVTPSFIKPGDGVREIFDRNISVYRICVDCGEYLGVTHLSIESRGGVGILFDRSTFVYGICGWGGGDI